MQFSACGNFPDSYKKAISRACLHGDERAWYIHKLNRKPMSEIGQKKCKWSMGVLYAWVTSLKRVYFRKLYHECMHQKLFMRNVWFKTYRWKQCSWSLSSTVYTSVRGVLLQLIILLWRSCTKSLNHVIFSQWRSQMLRHTREARCAHGWWGMPTPPSATYI